MSVVPVTRSTKADAADATNVYVPDVVALVRTAKVLAAACCSRNEPRTTSDWEMDDVLLRNWAKNRLWASKPSQFSFPNVPVPEANSRPFTIAGTAPLGR